MILKQPSGELLAQDFKGAGLNTTFARLIYVGDGPVWKARANEWFYTGTDRPCVVEADSQKEKKTLKGLD